MTDRHSDKISFCVTISDDDIYEAMKSIDGYLDITSKDFKEVYQVAYKHALNRVTKSVEIKEVMTKDVVTVIVDTPIIEVSDKLSEHSISGMPVVDDSGKPVGVISEKDLLSRMGADHTLTFMSVVTQCLKHKGCEVMKIANLTAKDIMTTPPICISENAPMHQAVSVFMSKKLIEYR